MGGPGGAGLTGPLEASPRRAASGLALPLGLGLATGAVVVLLAGLGVGRQVAVVGLLAIGPPLLYLFLTRPHLALGAYLFLLPLLVPRPVALGLNGGELLTLLVLLLAGASLWNRSDALARSIRELRWILWPLAGLALVSVVSMLVNAVGSFPDIVSALFKILAFGMVPVLVHVHGSTEAARRTMLRGLLLGAAAVAVYSVFAYVAGMSYSETYGYNRAAGTFSTWNYLGAFMALMSVPTLGYAVRKREVWSRALLVGFFLLEIGALLLSLTLGSLVALGIAAFVAALFLFRVGWRRVFAAALLFGLSFAVVYATNAELRDKLGRLNERIVDRLITYEVGVKMFADHVWFGFGSPERLIAAFQMGTTHYGLTALGESSVIPHNSLILIGVEKGIFGVVLFVLLAIGAVVLLLRPRRVLLASARDGALYQGVVVGSLAFMAQSMTNNLLLHGRLGILFFSMIALTARIGRARVEAAPPPAPEPALPPAMAPSG